MGIRYSPLLDRSNVLGRHYVAACFAYRRKDTLSLFNPLKFIGGGTDQNVHMNPLALSSTIISIAMGCIVGATLLRRAARTRQLPEFAVGLGLFAFYALSRPLSIISAGLGDSVGSGAQFLLLTGSTIGSGLGLFGLLLFTWQVFRAWSRAATAAFGAALIGILVTRFGIMSDFLAVPESQVPSFADSPFWVGVSVVLWTGAWFWTSGESLRYYAMLRRRLRLGLADPVVANRFFLWGMGCGVAGLGRAVGRTLRSVNDRSW